MGNKFLEDLSYGQSKEVVVLNLVIIEYGIEGVIENDKNKHDIRLLKECLVEVKTDKRIKTTKKLWIEYCGNTKRQKEGFLLYSDCHILAYCVIDSKQYNRVIKVIFIDFIALREYIKKTYFNGNFNNPITDDADVIEASNSKAMLISLEEVRPFIISVFSTIDKKEIYVNDKNISLFDIVNFLDDILKVKCTSL